MTITYEIHVEGDIVRVKASGIDESLREVQDYGMAIVEAAVASQNPRVLCDERELDYALDTLDTYDCAAFLASHVTHPQAKIAIVPKPEHLDDASFWEDVAVNRGLTVRMFRDMEEAEAWLAD